MRREDNAAMFSSKPSVRTSAGLRIPIHRFSGLLVPEAADVGTRGRFLEVRFLAVRCAVV